MIGISILVLTFGVTLPLSILGAVLVCQFLLANRPFAIRVALAAILGVLPTAIPVMLGGFMGAIAGFELGDASRIVFYLLLVLLIPVVVIGWPVAHIATKKLDNLLQFDAGIFE